MNLDDRLKGVKIMRGIDMLYNDGSTSTLEEIESIAYTEYDVATGGHRNIHVNRSFASDPDVLRGLLHHEHGHVAFTVLPDEALTDRRKKSIHNLLEDIRLEHLVAMIFPSMSSNFNKVIYDNLEFSPIEENSKYLELTQQLFAFRFIQHGPQLYFSAKHYDGAEVAEVLDLLFMSLMQYRDAYDGKILTVKTVGKSISSVRTRRKVNVATSYYVKAIKKAFELIDNDTSPQSQQEFDKFGMGGAIVVSEDNDENQQVNQDGDNDLPDDVETIDTKIKEPEGSGSKDPENQQDTTSSEDGENLENGEENSGSGSSVEDENKKETEETGSSSWDQFEDDENKDGEEIDDSKDSDDGKNGQEIEEDTDTGSDVQDAADSIVDVDRQDRQDDMETESGEKEQEELENKEDTGAEETDDGEDTGGGVSEKGCSDEGTLVVSMDELEEALKQKVEEQIERMSDTIEDPEVINIEENVYSAKKHNKENCNETCRHTKPSIKDYNIPTSEYGRPVPNKLSKVLFDGRKHVRVEKSAMRMDSAPLSGSGRKYLQVKHADFHFTIELCLDISGSVKPNILYREWAVAASLFETFKSVAKIKLSVFSSAYFVIDEDAKDFPSPEGFHKSGEVGGTSLFPSIKMAIEGVPPYETYVLVAITDGQASGIMAEGISNEDACRLYLKQIQKKNRFVIVIPVVELGTYVHIFGKYVVLASNKNLKDPLHIQQLIDEFSELVVELYEEVI